SQQSLTQQNQNLLVVPCTRLRTREDRAFQAVDRIALHFNPRFNAKGNINTIVCNSFEAGRWCEEKREKTFPFCQGQEFKIVIKFILSEFVVTLPCDSTIHFPNRFGAEKYSVMTFKGDALIRSIEIKFWVTFDL
uniref:Galectin n=1 Tax=Amphilophus citrinellus TaxID=61819 RepID=A0A3Q0R2K7_AMPCI